MTGRCRPRRCSRTWRRLSAARRRRRTPQLRSTPSGVSASTSIGSVALAWTASSDNVGVSATTCTARRPSGFTPAAGNRIAQPTGTSYTDSGLAAGTYYYRVTAEDAAGNISAASAQVTAVVPADQPPTVSITAPAGGATVSGTVSVTAGASDDVGVAGVQFRLGAANLGVRGHLGALLHLLGHDHRQQRQLLDHAPSPATPPARPPPPLRSPSPSATRRRLPVSSRPTDSTRARARPPPTRPPPATRGQSPARPGTLPAGTARRSASTASTTG